MDILITRHKGRAYVVGVSDKGRNVLFDNYTLNAQNILIVSEDYLQEISMDLTSKGLEVETK